MTPSHPTDPPSPKEMKMDADRVQRERIAAPHGRCPHCNAPNQPFTEECRHRRACEGRQMLQAGEPVEKAAAHAQGRKP